jgi:hypothetical protein
MRPGLTLSGPLACIQQCCKDWFLVILRAEDLKA